MISKIRLVDGWQERIKEYTEGKCTMSTIAGEYLLYRNERIGGKVPQRTMDDILDSLYPFTDWSGWGGIFSIYYNDNNSPYKFGDYFQMLRFDEDGGTDREDWVGFLRVYFETTKLKLEPHDMFYDLCVICYQNLGNFEIDSTLDTEHGVFPESLGGTCSGCLERYNLEEDYKKFIKTIQKKAYKQAVGEEKDE